MTDESMHLIGLRDEQKRARIRELELEVARLKSGARPASAVRDLAMTALLQIRADLESDQVDRGKELLGKLIKALDSNIDGAVKPPAPPSVVKDGLKPYVPLDHGARDNDAAAPQYRTPQ